MGNLVSREYVLAFAPRLCDDTGYNRETSCPASGSSYSIGRVEGEKERQRSAVKMQEDAR